MKNKAVNQFLNYPNRPSISQGNWATHRDHVKTELLYKYRLVATFYTHTSPVNLERFTLVDCEFEYPMLHTISNVQTLIKRTYQTRFKD